jgi:hypothetical protein
MDNERNFTQENSVAQTTVMFTTSYKSWENGKRKDKIAIFHLVYNLQSEQLLELIYHTMYHISE